MNKLIRTLPALLFLVLGISLTACSDDDNPKQNVELPDRAKSFVASYFPALNIVSTQLDNHEYETLLSDGTRIDFDLDGLWTDVNAPKGKVVPSGFYPAAIDSYIASNMAGAGINEIERVVAGYDVELLSGVELKFDALGAFIAR